MRALPFVLACLCATPALHVAAAVQERVKPAQSGDFPTLVDEARKAWDGKQYGACLKSLRSALGIVTIERVNAIQAALPAAPEGFEKIVQKQAQDAASNPLLGALSVGVGSVVEQRYKETKGGATIGVTITADSPLVQMFSMWINNPSLLEKGSELIKYKAYNAVLKKQGDSLQLMILIGSDICDVNLRGRNDEFLLKLFDQAAVDRLAGVLAN